MIEGKRQQIDKRKRGSMDKGSTILELSRSLVLPRKREDNFSIPMEEVARITIMAPRMVKGMEEAMTRTVPTINPSQEGSGPHYLLQVPEDWTLCQ